MSESKEEMKKVLEWSDADPKDEAMAKRISKKLQLGEIYFSFNVPLQIWIIYNEDENPESGINLEESAILNYMPRKEGCRMENLSDIFSSDEEISTDDLQDFMRVAAVILRNLARRMDDFNPLDMKKNLVYYPNQSDE